MTDIRENYIACWHLFKRAYEAGLADEAIAAAEDRAGEAASPSAAKLVTGTIAAIKRADADTEIRAYYEDFCQCWNLMRDALRGPVPIPDETWQSIMDRCYEIGARGPVARSMVIASLEVLEEIDKAAKAAHAA